MARRIQLACLGGLAACAAGAATLTVDPNETLREIERHRLVGSNIALWNQPWELSDSELVDRVRALQPTFIRIPGGSWANHYVWNGNGIRLEDGGFDLTKLKDGVWDVDYSGYAPGFNIEGDERKPVADDFHGSWHVKQLHDFVETFGAEAIVTVNVGTGTPEMAAEWVRWANLKNDYKVTYWELGNELEGSWELGHILLDGSKMTGEVYAKRFAAFAKAMKAVDPSIKTGGPASSNDRGAFIEEVLRDEGELVDFVSFHTYPVENRVLRDADFYREIEDLGGVMKRVRGWIETHQRARADEIEVAITEWNSQVVENRVTADLMNGLWCSMWIGEMMRHGVSFANQWDMMTATATGGHGLFYFDQFDFEQPGVPQEEMDRQFESFDPPCVPKGQYWALYLWSRHMGDRLVDARLEGAEDLYSIATRDDDALRVMFVNTSRETARTVRLNSAEGLADKGAVTLLSHREYFWNPFTRRPQWSRAPETVEVDLAAGAVTVPPFCVMVLEAPLAGKRVKAAAPEAARMNLELLAPESTPEDVPVEAWVLMPESGAYVSNAKALLAELKVEGPAKLDRGSVRVNEGAGRFFITPTGRGEIKVTATLGEGSAEIVVRAKPVETREEVLWTFEGADGLAGVASDFEIGFSDNAKPNQRVAEIRLRDSISKPGKGGLAVFAPMPDGVPKERVGGVFFELRASRNFAEKHPYAGIEVVLQSEADHWIPIGRVKASDLKDEWTRITLPIEDAAHYDSMKWLYSARLQLTGDQPVSGEIYLNDAGLILR